MKQTIRLTEQDLRQIVSESVKKYLKEDYDNNPLFSVYSDMIDACGNIIFNTETKGRRFTDNAIKGLVEDSQFMELKQELMENMERYFNSAKMLLGYITKRCQAEGEEYLAEKAQRWLSKEFTPQW